MLGTRRAVTPHAGSRRRSARAAVVLLAVLSSALVHAWLLTPSGRRPVAAPAHVQAPVVQVLPPRRIDPTPAAPLLAPIQAPIPAPPAVPRGPDLARATEPPSPGVTNQATAEPAPTTTQASPQTTDELPASSLDRPALPRSAPDPHVLDDVTLTGLPLRLRVCSDAAGRVTRVDVLQASPDDAEAVAALQQMFHATAYIPGRLNGHDVASCTDLDIGIGPEVAH